MNLSMRHVILFALALGFVAGPARAQSTTAPAPPAAGFVRHADPASHVVFYAPAGWTAKAGPTTLTSGAGGYLRVIHETVPEGIGIAAYLGATVAGLRSTIGDGEPPVARRIRLAGLDAREIEFEALSPQRGRQRFRVALTVRGAHAVSIIVGTPVGASTAGDEAFLAVVDSLVLVDDQARLTLFESSCTGPFSKTDAMPLAERSALVRVVDGVSETDRRAAIGRLATLCSSAPRSVADLLLDGRPVVRAAAIEALDASGVRPIDDLLAFALADEDTFVKERAGRAVARMPNATEVLERRYGPDFGSKDFLRAAALLPIEGRVAIAGRLLAEPPATPTSIALALLADVPPDRCAIPYARLLASKNEWLFVQALDVGTRRGEAIPLDVLLAALGSSNESIFISAAVKLARSGQVGDLPRVEAARRKTVAPAGWRQEPAKLIARVASCVRLRAELAVLAPADRRRRFDEELARTATEDRLWLEIVRDLAQPPVGAPSPDGLAGVDVGVLGERAFPEDLDLFAAAPDPEDTLERMVAGLQGVQLGTARDQARFALMLASLRDLVARTMGTTAADLTFEHLGVAPHAPMSFGVWSVSRPSPEVLTRAAAVVRVVDRDRFERTIALAAEHADEPWWQYPKSASAAVRMVALMPALAPLIGLDVVRTRKRDEPSTAKNPPSETANSRRSVRDAVYRGVPIKIFARRSVAPSGGVTNTDLWLAYAGDRAVLASGSSALHDVVDRLLDGSPSLASNAELGDAVRGGGDIVYMSRSGEGDGNDLVERGALRVSGDGWENAFRLSGRTTTDAHAETFSPAEAAAPKELLPSSTVLYAVGRGDVAALWRTEYAPIVDEHELATFEASMRDAGIDVEKDILTGLGPELGVAMLELPHVLDEDGAPLRGLVVFFKVREDALDRLRGVFQRLSAAKPSPKEPQKAFYALKNGYLVIASDADAIGRLDEPEKLASTAAYRASIDRVPARVVGFGGFAVDAALARAERDVATGDTRDIVDTIEAVARAFTKHGFWIAPAADGSEALDARLDVRLGHDGAHAVSVLAAAPDAGASFATVDAGGMSIALQDRLERLTIRIRSSAPDALESIREDVAAGGATVDSETPTELVVTTRPRRPEAPGALKLPVADPALAPFLAASRDVRSDAESVRKTAREIVATDTDAWSVARKLATWTHTNLKWKRVDDADAVDTLATREADCLEFSELYVAMARSVGLPARIVHGMAYSGGTFGGHAWVEVWAGRWIELDPTWGTEYVDATHVRSATSSFVAYAALGVVAVDVVAAPRVISDARRDPTTLVTAICQDLSESSTAALADALDPAVLADETLGQGAWASLDPRERRAFLGGVERLPIALREALDADNPFGLSNLRVARVDATGDRATALVVGNIGGDEVVSRVRLLRRDDVWSVVEVEAVDTGVRALAEELLPVVETIRARRRDSNAPPADYSPAARVAARARTSAADALEAAEAGLAAAPADRQLRLLRAMQLDAVKRHDDAVAAYVELCADASPPPAALFLLAESLQTEKTPDDARCIDLYERYSSLEPNDPRPHSRLGWLLDDPVRAEHELRAAIALDPRSTDAAVDLADFLLAHRRAADAVAWVDGAPCFAKGKGFEALVERQWDDGDTDGADLLVAACGARISASASASENVGRTYLDNDRPADAVAYLRRAVVLQPKDRDVRVLLIDAQLARKQWRVALAEADAAIAADDKSPGAHFDRACALAQLGRAAAAIASLRRAIELDDDYAYGLEDDDYLTPIATRADFKELVPKDDEPAE